MMDVDTDRQISDVDKVVHLAKLDSSDLLPRSQVLHFDRQLLDLDRIRLIEVHRELADLLASGDSLVLRGDPEDHAVLCTRGKTYDIKEAETSNSLLMLDGLSMAGDLDPQEDRCLQQRKIRGVFHRSLCSRTFIRIILSDIKSISMVVSSVLFTWSETPRSKRASYCWCCSSLFQTSE